MVKRSNFPEWKCWQLFKKSKHLDKLWSMCCCIQLFATPRTVAHQPPLSMEFPGKNTGVGCHRLLQGFILTQGSNPCLLHWQVESLPLSPQGSPMVKWYLQLNGGPQDASPLWQSIEERSHSVVSNSLRSHGLYPTRLLRPWDFPGKSTGMGCHFLLQGIFLTQGSNPGLPQCRQILYHLSHQVG